MGRMISNLGDTWKCRLGKFNIGDTVTSNYYGGNYVVIKEFDLKGTNAVKRFRILLIEKNIINSKSYYFHILKCKTKL